MDQVALEVLVVMLATQEHKEMLEILA